MINNIITSGNEYEVENEKRMNSIHYINSPTTQYIDVGYNQFYNMPSTSNMTIKIKAWHYDEEMIACVETKTGRVGFWDTVDKKFWEVDEFLKSFSKDAEIKIFY